MYTWYTFLYLVHVISGISVRLTSGVPIYLTNLCEQIKKPIPGDHSIYIGQNIAGRNNVGKHIGFCEYRGSNMLCPPVSNRCIAKT